MKKTSFMLASALLVIAFLINTSTRAQDNQVIWTQVVRMDAAQAGSESGSMGLAILRVTSDMKLTYKILVQQIDEGDQLMNAHIHYGAMGVNGAPFIPLQDGILEMGKNMTVQLNQAQFEELVNGTEPIYINVHTLFYPVNSIRGQIR